MSKNNKNGSLFVSIATGISGVLLLLGIWNGLKYAFGKNEDKSRLWLFIILFAVSISLVLIASLFPAKLRGANKVSVKVRLTQIFMILGIFIFLGGIAVVFYFCIQDPENTKNYPAVIGAGIAVGGFGFSALASAILKRLIDRGEAEPEDQTLFGEDPNDKYKDMIYIDPHFDGENGLSDEERERELKRIEGQDDPSMSKGQVELHEDLKHGRH